MNQRFPSGPAAIWQGPEFADGTMNLVIEPAVVTRKMLPEQPATQRFPSGPAVIPVDPEPDGLTKKSVIVIAPADPPHAASARSKVAARLVTQPIVGQPVRTRKGTFTS